MRTSTPVYQTPHQHQTTPNRSGGTIIRLGPTTVDYATTNGRKPTGSNSGISRTQSLLTPSGSKQPFQDSPVTPVSRVYSSPVGNNIINQQYNTTTGLFRGHGTIFPESKSIDQQCQYESNSILYNQDATAKAGSSFHQSLRQSVFDVPYIGFQQQITSVGIVSQSQIAAHVRGGRAGQSANPSRSS